MRAKIISTGLLAILFLPGCSTISGKWSLAEVQPTAARRDFQYDVLTLQKDGTFYAEAKEAGQVSTTSGRYSYNDRENLLNLVEHDGEKHTYDARMVSADTLELGQFWNGQRLRARFEKKVE